LPRLSHATLRRACAGGACMLVLAVVLASRVGAIDLRAMRATIDALHDDAARERYSQWRGLIAELAGAPEPVRLRRVNEFFNRTIRFADDQVVWHQEDYWATPLETLGAGAGDCEDYAIAKYFTLQELGIPVRKLRMTYVLATVGGRYSHTTVAHMVVAYYDTPDAEPLLLDSLIADIQSASERPDLKPVYSFNAQGVWMGTAPSPTPVDRLSRWQDVLIKMHKEGHVF